jgi:BirA family transcriptional regulator, biotin operon repressor / biotin---[acetyl-CoA-carboxylase] ligase
MKHQYPLIQLLADGKFHSGEELGQKLQITRSAICKHVQQLSRVGIDVHRVKGKGYQIPQGIELLNLLEIKQHLSLPLSDKADILILPETRSTNQYLLDRQGELPSGFMLLAEHQTAGRGRQHKEWFSPFGANLYFSLLWNFDRDPSELCGLSLATGVAVANTLERYGICQVQLKWPNDILYNTKKVSGILIEMTAETHSRTQVVIGIGLNISMPTNNQLDQQWTDVATITGHRPKRNQLAALLIEEVTDMLHIFAQKGFNAFVQHWQALDAYYDKPVTLYTPTQQFSGIAKGINRQGEFILVDHNNQERRFLHGEVSFKPIGNNLLQ